MMHYDKYPYNMLDRAFRSKLDKPDYADILIRGVIREVRTLEPIVQEYIKLKYLYKMTRASVCDHMGLTDADCDECENAISAHFMMHRTLKRITGESLYNVESVKRNARQLEKDHRQMFELMRDIKSGAVDIDNVVSDTMSGYIDIKNQRHMESFLNNSVEIIGLSKRVNTALDGLNIVTIRDLANSKEDIVRNTDSIGDSSIQSMLVFLSYYGLSFDMKLTTLIQ